MRYEVISEFGIKKFYKIERLRDFLWVYFPKWIHKLTVYRIKKKNGFREVGKFVNSKEVIMFK